MGEILAGTAVSHPNFINSEGDFKEVYLGEPDININIPDWNHSIWDTVGEGTYYLHTVIDGNHDVGERNGVTAHR
uniref:hypothetical protein n=1 Tax=Crocosphaera watsonii TaxID=263511 RepID=UPI0006503717